MTPLDLAALDALYDVPAPRSLTKVQDHLTPNYRAWIERSRFAVVSTVGPQGTDGSPRGDAGPVVRVADDRTLLLPDWMGNNRLDTLRNLVRDGRISLMFMVPGSQIVVRVNGTAIVTADDALRATFDQGGKHPRSVVVITVSEVYFQCAKSIMRSGIWSGQDETAGLPTGGEFLQEADAATDAKEFDETYPTYARTRLW